MMQGVGNKCRNYSSTLLIITTDSYNNKLLLAILLVLITKCSKNKYLVLCFTKGTKLGSKVKKAYSEFKF